MSEGRAPEPAAATVQRLESLTALRALAAFAVFTTHVGMLLVHQRWIQRVTAQGVSGVSFFFILSGFVLTWSYRPPVRGRTFYRRRFARIYPAYAVALAAGAAVNGWVHGFSHLRLGPSTAATFLVQSWVLKGPTTRGTV